MRLSFTKCSLRVHLPQSSGLLDTESQSSLGIVQRINILQVVQDIFQQVCFSQRGLDGTIVEVSEVDMKMVEGRLVMQVCSQLVLQHTVPATYLFLEEAMMI